MITKLTERQRQAITDLFNETVLAETNLQVKREKINAFIMGLGLDPAKIKKVKVTDKGLETE